MPSEQNELIYAQSLRPAQAQNSWSSIGASINIDWTNDTTASTTTSADNCVMLPQHDFHGINLSLARKHWMMLLENVSHFKEDKVVWILLMNQNMFELMLTDITLSWFDLIMNSTQDLNSLKGKFLNRFNSGDKTQWQ